MKTIFVVNPAAGKRKQVILPKIPEHLKQDVEIYITEKERDGERFVREYCKTNGAARFIACGGDGTLNEVLNGAFECKGAEIGVFPTGTGNDFIRNFPDADFRDISLLVSGKTVLCDAIRYRTTVNGEVKEGYAANMFNIGFDCAVADLTTTIKQKTFFSCSAAYFIAILLTLIRKKCYFMVVDTDGEEKYRGDLLLTSLANGCFCGGGIKSNPLASVSDGLININIIRNVSMLRFISLLPSYMKGTHVKKKGIERIIMSAQCKRVAVSPENEKMRLCIDGEITDGGETEFEIVRDAFRFVVPSKEEN